MAIDIIETFLAAPTAERLRMARDRDTASTLKQYLGEAVYEEYARLADRVDESHLSISHPPNLIFIPGVMGSMLRSRTKGGIWWVDVRTRNHIDDLRLSPDGLSDADQNNQIVPCSTDPLYEPFLTATLNRDDFGHELFPYDWRKPLELSAPALRDLITTIYDANGNEPVHLVAHSMGGLMARATLMKYGDELWPKLGRIVFIGSPHYGAPAIAGYLKNHLWGFDLMALMGRYLSPETFRSLRGVINLLPAPRGVYPGTRAADPSPWKSDNANDVYVHPCANFDLYQAENWKLDLTPAQLSYLQDALNGASEFHQKMFQTHQSLSQDLRDRMLVIIGVGYKTLFRLAYEPAFFGLWDRALKETRRIPGDPHREGDGRVSLASAALENVQARFVKGIHAGLTNLPEVYSEVFRWLNEERLELPETPEEALSQHLASGALESETPNLNGTAKSLPYTDDPGFWEIDGPDTLRLDHLESNLEAGQIPNFVWVRLL